jgi:hypothetical protein
MRKILVILAAGLVVTGAAASGQEKPEAKPNDAFQDTVVANERALQAAVAKTDKQAFVSLVLPEGTWTTKQGFIPMNLLADGLLGFDITKWEIINPHVTRLSEDSAVVRYVWSGTGTRHGEPLPGVMLASTVWIKREGKWRAVHHQRTELAKN